MKRTTLYLIPLFTRSLCGKIDSGLITSNSWVDQLLGRINAYLHGHFGEDINDHSTSEYIRLFKEIMINSKLRFVAKAGKIAAKAAEKVKKAFDRRHDGFAALVCLDMLYTIYICNVPRTGHVFRYCTYCIYYIAWNMSYIPVYFPVGWGAVQRR